MRRWLLSIVLVCITGFFLRAAQNDWIDYSQDYYKFPIASNGVYRLTYENMIAAGIPVPSINPEKIQIFQKGAERALFVSTSTAGSFSSGDYIEFYAEGNDGWLDSALFADPLHQGNPDYSMVSDSINCFLTWGAVDGKRMTVEGDISFDGYSPARYYMKERLIMNSASYNAGEVTIFGRPTPEFSPGGGWCSVELGFRGSYIGNFDTQDIYPNGQDARIRAGVVGRYNNLHMVELRLNGTAIDSKTYYNYGIEHFDVAINPNLLNGPAEFRFLSLEDSGNDKEKWSVSYLSLKYPSIFDLRDTTEQMMGIVSDGSTKNYLSISNFNNLGSTVWFYDLSNDKKIAAQVSGGIVEILVPDNGTDRLGYLTSESIMKNSKSISSSAIRPVGGAFSSKFTDYQTASQAKTFFIIHAEVLESSAQEYSDYRTQSGHDAVAINVEQLYDQFAYGVRKHPIAIRNLILASIQEWGNAPEYLLLLGKGVPVSILRSGVSEIVSSVPTWGEVGTDIGFSNSIPGSNVLDPAVSTGRIAATTASQTTAYLDKVKDFETAQQEPRPWMKNILHFGGGISSSEQQTFKNYLDQYESIIEDTLYGGTVHTFLKTSSDPLQINLSDSVTDLINGGVSLMTFFGHAYGQNFDQSIDEPENYENTGKYGIILANSCLIGNIFTGSTSSGSERFVLAENKGTVGFIGSSTLGVPSYLHQYSSSFYEQVSSKSYGNSIGYAIQQTIKDIQDTLNDLNRDVCLHMTLHGDPSLVLNSHPHPDYSLYADESNLTAEVYTEPAQITTDLDSFDLKVIIRNLGMAVQQDVDLTIKRTYATGLDTSYGLTVSNLYFKDTISLTLPVDFINGPGVNRVDVHVDPLNVHLEMSEANNQAEISFVIESDDLIPIYPYEFAVVPNRATTLKASTVNPYLEQKTFVLQIDTTEFFNSPSLYSENKTSLGGVVAWDPSQSNGLLAFYNSFPEATTVESPTVFFWRVKELSDGDDKYRGSSFQYVKDKSGWGQAHFHQLKKNDFDFMGYDYDNKSYEFVEQTKTMQIQNSYLPSFSNRYPIAKLEGAIFGQYSTVPWSHINVVVIDKNTLTPWRYDEHGDFGHLQMISYVKVAEDWNDQNFAFASGSLAGSESMVNLLKSVPDSNYFALYSYKDNWFSYMYNTGSAEGDSLYSYLDELGVNVDTLADYENNFPIIIFGQKGNPSATKEYYNTNLEDLLVGDYQMYNNWLSGTITSTRIGPSTKWNSFHWGVKEGEAGNDKDSSRIALYGVQNDDSKTLFVDTTVSTGDILDLSFIDAGTYPYLELSLYLEDDSLRTPKEFDRWQVLFDEIPEAALNPLQLTSYELKDTVYQGEEFTLKTAIENVSLTDMDSIQVVYWMVDNSFNVQNVNYKHLPALPAGEVIYDSVSLSTTSLEGRSGIWYDVNPFVGEKPWQLEQYHFNNTYLADFGIQKDLINPILDVTFDGIHILDGDIVSPKPFIVITLDDENQYLNLDDPDLIQVFIKSPTSPSDEPPLLLDQSDYEFIPGTAPENKARIELQGDFPDDGVYSLQVMSRDVSNNISGKGDLNDIFDYSISFEVINKSSISQVMNWPNPFSTSTQFVFTLTGSVVPDEFRIQVMSVTGKVVREITKDEFGPINIGRNISSFKWDGKDEYGDQLANGVYLYRVIISSSEVDFEERIINISDNTGTTTVKEKFFKAGFGKMYLLR